MQNSATVLQRFLGARSAEIAGTARTTAASYERAFTRHDPGATCSYIPGIFFSSCCTASKLHGPCCRVCELPAGGLTEPIFWSLRIAAGRHCLVARVVVSHPALNKSSQRNRLIAGATLWLRMTAQLLSSLHVQASFQALTQPSSPPVRIVLCFALISATKSLVLARSSYLVEETERSNNL